MVLFGTLINGFAIIIGSIIGALFKDINENYKQSVIQGVSLVVILIGIQMALETNLVIIVLLSLLIGAIIEETLQIEDRINMFSNKIATKIIKSEDKTQSTEGFITASLVFVVGAMAIIGSLDSGVRGDHEILLTKAVLDGFASIVFTASLGISV